MTEYHCLEPQDLEVFLERRRAVPSFALDMSLADNLAAVLRKANEFVGLQISGLKAPGLAELGRLVEDLDYLRCAPELSASESLTAELVARSLKLARSLR